MSRFLRFKFTLILCAAVTSCYAPISVHKIKPTPPAPVVMGESALKSASGRPEKSLLAQTAATLESVRIAYDRLAEGDARALPEYNYLLGRFIEQIRASGIKPWQNEVELPGSTTRYVVRGGQPKDLDVPNRDFLLTDSINFTGKYTKGKPIVSGVGAPLIALLNTPPTGYEAFDKNFRYRNVTAVVSFKDNRATVELVDPYVVEDVSIGGHRYPIHADFGANLSYGLSKARIDKLGFTRMLNPQRFSDTCDLSRLQPYDPKRIPILMVHGLQDTPASWIPMYLKLMEDPKIRETYQFWVFSYPSGYPYPYSAALLRQELDRMNRTFPGHKDIVIVAHSMGSLLTRLMVTDVGDKLWLNYFGTPPAETEISGRSRKVLEDSIIFNARKDVDRAIFIAAPHKGSDFASNWIGRLGSKLVRAPAFIADTRDSMVNVGRADSAAMVLNNAPNSIDTLAPNNRFILEINKHPISKQIPYHSIMGDRGKGDMQNSSDGFVAYWSSHLEGAASEKIVPSDHSAHQNPEGIEEVHRILLMHAGLN